jgi:hypothetical protein
MPLARPLLGSMRQFPTAEHVNCFLGNLLTQLAFGRIDCKDAVALAYISQLLLTTYPAMDRERKEELDPHHQSGLAGSHEHGMRPGRGDPTPQQRRHSDKPVVGFFTSALLTNRSLEEGWGQEDGKANGKTRRRSLEPMAAS